MGWFQDVRNTIDYYSKLKAHRQQGQQLESTLKQMEETIPNYQDREREMLKFRDRNAAAFSKAAPEPPKKMSAFGRWWARKNVPTKEETKAYEATQYHFSDAIYNVTEREVRMHNVVKREAAIVKGGERVAEHQRQKQAKAEAAYVPLAEMIEGRIAQSAACGRAKAEVMGGPQRLLAQKDIDRLSRLIVSPELSQEENVQRMQVAQTLSLQQNMKAVKDPNFNQALFDQSVSQMAGYLKPKIDAYNAFNLREIDVDNLGWLDSQKAAALGEAGLLYMPLSDCMKGGCPELAVALGADTPEFQARGRMMDAAMRMTRGTVISDLGDGLTAEKMEGLVDKTVNREYKLIGGNGVQALPMSEAPTALVEACTGSNGQGYPKGFGGARNYQDMVGAVRVGTPAKAFVLNEAELNAPKGPPVQQAQAAPQRINHQQLGNQTGAAPKPPQQPAPKPPQPQKDAVQKTPPQAPHK